MMPKTTPTWFPKPPNMVPKTPQDLQVVAKMVPRLLQEAPRTDFSQFWISTWWSLGPNLIDC